MQDFYWSDRSSGSAGYHHCYSVKISSKDNKLHLNQHLPHACWGESESCWQNYDYLTLFAEIQFSLSLSFKGDFFPLFLRQVHRMKVPVYSKFWFLHLIQHAGNWQPPNDGGRRAQVKVPVPWSQNTLNCQSFLWTRAVKINAEYKFKASFQGDFFGSNNSAV